MYFLKKWYLKRKGWVFVAPYKCWKHYSSSHDIMYILPISAAKQTRIFGRSSMKLDVIFYDLRTYCFVNSEHTKTSRDVLESLAERISKY